MSKRKNPPSRAAAAPPVAHTEPHGPPIPDDFPAASILRSFGIDTLDALAATPDGELLSFDGVTEFMVAEMRRMANDLALDASRAAASKALEQADAEDKAAHERGETHLVEPPPATVPLGARAGTVGALCEHLAATGTGKLKIETILAAHPADSPVTDAVMGTIAKISTVTLAKARAYLAG